jgi:hypothetical protein
MIGIACALVIALVIMIVYLYVPKDESLVVQETLQSRSIE